MCFTVCDALPASSGVIQLDDIVPICEDGQCQPCWDKLASLRGRFRAAQADHLYTTQIPKKAVLGCGGFGKTWRARRRVTGEHVAVKNIHGSTSSVDSPLFAALHRCQHPCLARLFNVQLLDSMSMLIVIMELCPHGSLQSRLAKRRALSVEYEAPTEVDDWAACIFLGLEHLHQVTEMSFGHLIKPTNLLFDSTDRIKIADFDLKHVDLFRAPVLKRDFGYRAPELCDGPAHLNISCDLFSFGVLLWVMATGGLREFMEPQPPSVAPGVCDVAALWAIDFDQVPLFHSSSPTPMQSLALSLTAFDSRNRPSFTNIRQHSYLELPLVHFV